MFPVHLSFNPHYQLQKFFFESSSVIRIQSSSQGDSSYLSYIHSSLSSTTYQSYQLDPIYPLTLPSFSQFHCLTNPKSIPLHLLLSF
ncbi:hypothetical protein Hanom_Chr10g00874081 [Helianthus anomalus]